MSRIGKKPVTIPDGVRVAIENRTVTVEGPLGRLQLEHRPEVSVSYDEQTKQVRVTANDPSRQTRAYHGLTRALIQNMVIGVTKGYEKRLEIQGVGYMAAIVGNELHVRVGYANEIHKPIPEGLKVTCPDPQHIVVQGIDKQKVGEFAAEVRAIRKPDPYRGKGIRYQGEVIRRKESKAAAK